MLESNPYRVHYSKPTNQFDSKNLEAVRAKHQLRIKYYDWYTRGWLPAEKSSPILDIGCGAGQFLYFLKAKGYTNATGIDLSKENIDYAKKLGLNAKLALAHDYLANQPPSSINLIAMLDVVEHFTPHELFPLMEAAYEALASRGRIIVSVPNATSLIGLSTRFSDITHETCFSPTTLTQMFACHNMSIQAFRDPWPAPVSVMHKLWRLIALITRKAEAFRFKLLGFSAPKYWSSVIWAVAEKTS